jgi:hypothetical protein
VRLSSATTAQAAAKAAAEALEMKKTTVEWRARHQKFGFSYGNNLAIA